MTRSIEAELKTLQQQLAALPEAEEPPPTTLQVLGQHNQERAWQDLLVHFLTPTAPHGLEHALLEYVLTALSGRADLSYSFSRFDIDDIQIAQEVETSDGIPDVILWASEEWFICWELKLHADEGQDQTERYVGVDSFDGIGLGKADVPADGHHYIFLAPDSTSSPDADEFTHVSWEWLVAELQAFLVESYGEYPARTVAQLNDFIDTIRSELTMTDYEENQHEMVELYIENYGVISDLEAAFEDEWSEFEKTWGTQLAQTLDSATLIDDPSVPDEYAAVELELENGEKRQWTFRQGTSDWAWMFPRNWWRKLDEDRPVSDSLKPNARVGLLHRLEWDRAEAVRDNTLVAYLRNAPSGHPDFYNAFADRFNNTQVDIEAAIEGTNFAMTGNKSNVLRGEYEIMVDRYDDFFEAYVDTLARVLNETVISNPALVEEIDRLYENTIANDVSL